jgi:tRNA nucleotidyltransferase (CCA-adding enzyme)
MKKKADHLKAFDTIITTHANADFDAMASMLAAQKLYPEARVVFPGTQEKSLRNFFIDSMVYLYNMAEMKDIDLSTIKRLVLVDTRQANRIGSLSQLVGKPDVEIHIYDHHPAMEDDISGQVEIIRPTGATVTILAGILDEKGLAISPEEATVMCLGIYEDTGSFTFNSTTEDDFKAAAKLLARGANLNIVSDMITREISPQQLTLLNELFQSATTHNIHGIDVMVTTMTKDEYIPDFAFLVHKMIKMEDINALFAVACMGSKIYVVARSRIPEVDAADIMRAMGGGGHRFAASAAVREQTLPQTEDQLLKILYEKIPSRRTAGDLMSYPAITVEAHRPCEEAKELLTRYNINALLVTEPNGDAPRVVGYISRQVIEKAIFHQLGTVPVREYMTSELATVQPRADLFEVQEKIIENKQRILPVMEEDRLLGVVTRTDLLNTLVRQHQPPANHFQEPPPKPVPARTKNVSKFIYERLSARIIDLLKRIGETADRMDLSVYVVGGFVRDLFLYRPNEDIDIVVEGDGIAFAKTFAAQQSARIHSHEKFGTAVIIFPDGFKLDVASARVEYYDAPAALPIVEMGSIKLDMFRRDFTVNTLSIQLNAERFGTLVDFFSAQRDIKEKAIRVLHNLSFVEDPTRVFRAIRFEQRFDFSIGKLTANLIENAVKMDFFKRLSGRRVFSELRQIFEEENPTLAVIRLQDYDLLKVVHPSIKLDKELVSLLNAITNVLAWFDLLFLEEPLMRWAVYLMALIRHCDPATAREICRRFELPPRYHALFSTERSHARQCLMDLERRLPTKNSTLHKRLHGIKTELIVYMMAATRQEKVKRAISHYFTSLRNITPHIQGKDLKKIGLKPSPLYRELLDSVLTAKLDGRLKTRNDEIAFVRRHSVVKKQQAED